MEKQTMTLRCAAKINLSLDVTGKREDGYHTLESIFQSVSVYDFITITVQEGSGIELSCNIPYIPCNEKNLAYRAAATFLEVSGKTAKIQIHLQKQIPSGAGMGGGSADAAGVLYALNRMLRCRYSNKKLRAIGVTLGADVPFLLMGGTAYAGGVGELLTPLPAWTDIPLVIVKGRQSISTPAAYAAIDRLEDPVHPNHDAMLQAIKTQDMELLTQSCANLFEAAIDCKDVTRAKQALLRHGAKCAVMTGSGSAVFGIFDSKEEAQRCAGILQKQFVFAAACHTVGRSFRIKKHEIES